MGPLVIGGAAAAGVLTLEIVGVPVTGYTIAAIDTYVKIVNRLDTPFMRKSVGRVAHGIYNPWNRHKLYEMPGWYTSPLSQAILWWLMQRGAQEENEERFS